LAHGGDQQIEVARALPASAGPPTTCSTPTPQTSTPSWRSQPCAGQAALSARLRPVRANLRPAMAHCAWSAMGSAVHRKAGHQPKSGL